MNTLSKLLKRNGQKESLATTMVTFGIEAEDEQNQKPANTQNTKMKQINKRLFTGKSEEFDADELYQFSKNMNQTLENDCKNNKHQIPTLTQTFYYKNQFSDLQKDQIRSKMQSTGRIKNSSMPSMKRNQRQMKPNINNIMKIKQSNECKQKIQFLDEMNSKTANKQIKKSPTHNNATKSNSPQILRRRQTEVINLVSNSKKQSQPVENKYRVDDEHILQDIKNIFGNQFNKRLQTSWDRQLLLNKQKFKFAKQAIQYLIYDVQISIQYQKMVSENEILKEPPFIPACKKIFLQCSKVANSLECAYKQLKESDEKNKGYLDQMWSAIGQQMQTSAKSNMYLHLVLLKAKAKFALIMKNPLQSLKIYRECKCICSNILAEKKYSFLNVRDRQRISSSRKQNKYNNKKNRQTSQKDSDNSSNQKFSSDQSKKAYKFISTRTILLNRDNIQKAQEDMLWDLFFGLKIKCCNGIGKCFLKVRKFDSALKYFMQVILMAWATNDLQLELKAYEQCGLLFYYKGNLEMALFYHNKLIEGTGELHGSAIRQLGVQRIMRGVEIRFERNKMSQTGNNNITTGNKSHTNYSSNEMFVTSESEAGDVFELPRQYMLYRSNVNAALINPNSGNNSLKLHMAFQKMTQKMEYKKKTLNQTVQDFYITDLQSQQSIDSKQNDLQEDSIKNILSQDYKERQRKLLVNIRFQTEERVQVSKALRELPHEYEKQGSVARISNQKMGHVVFNVKGKNFYEDLEQQQQKVATVINKVVRDRIECQHLSSNNTLDFFHVELPDATAAQRYGRATEAEEHIYVNFDSTTVHILKCELDKLFSGFQFLQFKLGNILRFAYQIQGYQNHNSNNN